MPVNQEPASQRHYPGVPRMPRRHRRRRDEEGNVRRHVKIRHPVCAEYGRVRGREGDHGREASRRTAKRSGPAVTYADDECHEQAVQRVCGEQLAIPRRRHHVQPRPEQGFPGRLDVQVRGPGMVEVVLGVVSDQQCEMSCLLNQDRVRAHVRVLIQPRGEKKPVTDAQQHEQHCDRRHHHPPRRRRPQPPRTTGSGRDGRDARFTLR